jgi:hypothetical protein
MRDRLEKVSQAYDSAAMRGDRFRIGANPEAKTHRSENRRTGAMGLGIAVEIVTGPRF